MGMDMDEDDDDSPAVRVGSRTATPINEYITADPIRLIAPRDLTKDMPALDEDGELLDDKEGGDSALEEMLGIYSLEDALQLADEFDLDLVMVNDKIDPPLCKIVNYGKYMYKQEKKKKENQRKQVRSGIKELKMT